jgi:hypothetical protein
MRQVLFGKLAIFLLALFLPSCTVYTEKRSEALSQAVFATADSINGARFDLSYKYAEQAKRLAYPPKKAIEVSRIFTKEPIALNDSKISLVQPSIVTATLDNKEQRPVLRLVVPEFLKHTKLLIENSEEWNEMVKTKEFAKQLEIDKQNLQKLTSDIDAELQKQYQMNSKMVEDLNKLQKQVLAKDLHIIKLYIVIVGLILTLGGGVYLRMKGIL